MSDRWDANIKGDANIGDANTKGDANNWKDANPLRKNQKKCFLPAEVSKERPLYQNCIDCIKVVLIVSKLD